MILYEWQKVNSALFQMVDLNVSKLPGISVFVGAKILMLVYGDKWKTKQLVVIYIIPSTEQVFQVQEECMIYVIIEQKCNFEVYWLRQIFTSWWNE